MPRTAIVTLSCPHCGGRTDGVRSLEAPQTIPCPYCRTELHVPRVGERVIDRERIIERVVEVTPESEPMSPTFAWTMVVLFVVGVLILLVIKCRASPPVVSDWNKEQATKEQERTTCKQTCKASCPASAQTVHEVLDRDLAYNSDAFDRAFARERCLSDCDLTCRGVVPRHRNP